MFRGQFFRSAGVAAVVLIGLVTMAAGQVARSAPPATRAPADDLLTEVRALRGEINAAAAASIRAQLFVARLQLQEQRVNAVARQITDVQTQLATLRQGQAAMRERLRVTEEGQALLRLEDRSDDQIRALTLQIEQGQNQEQALQRQETTLFSAAAAEQSKWSEFNGRLDELERSLSAGVAR